MNVSTVTNHFSTANKGFITTLGSSILSGATTIPLTSVSGLTNGTIFVGIIEPGLSNEQEFTGTVDTAGVQITGVKWTDGTDVDHTAGVTIVDYVAATDWNMNTKGLLVSHDQDGTLKAGAVDNAGVIASDIITNTQMATAVKPETNFTETTFDFVASGCVWSGDAYGSTRNASMTAGVVYIGGRRVAVSAVTARSFTASKDVYVDVDNTGTLTYTDTTTNAASPALAANSIRLAIIVVGASNIAAVGSVNQGQENKVLPIASSVPYAVTDSLGNLICPRDPNRRTLGYRQLITNKTTNASTEETIEGLVVPFIVPTGRKVKVSGTANIYSVGVAGELQLYIKESTTYLATAKRLPAAINNPQETSVTFVGTPSAGLHTYTLNYGATTNNVGVEASATAPAFIMVELA